MRIVFDGRKESEKAIKTALLLSEQIDVVFPETTLLGEDLALYPADHNEYEYLLDAQEISMIKQGFKGFGDNIKFDEKIVSLLNNVDKLPTKIRQSITDPRGHLLTQSIITEKHISVLDTYAKSIGIKWKDQNEYFSILSSLLNGLYYYGQIYSVLLSEIQGESLISCNGTIDYLVNEIMTDSQLMHKEAYVPNLVELFIPDLSSLSYENITDIKNCAGDELIAMKQYIADISSKYKSSGNSQEDVNEFIEHDVKTAIEEFRRKVTTSNLETVKSAMKSLANPLSYSPLVVSLFADIPAQKLALASAGLIGAEVVISTIQEKLALKNDPLYFSMKLGEY